MSGEERIDESAVRGRTRTGEAVRGPKTKRSDFFVPLSYSDEPADIICGENPQTPIDLFLVSHENKKDLGYIRGLYQPKYYFQYSNPLSEIPAFAAINSGFLPSFFCLQ